MPRLIMLALSALLLGFTITAGAAAQSWTVVSTESRIGFSGTHAGTTFKGTFETWSAEIRFDPEDLANSKAVVTVDLTSARTGNATYDKTLPSADWLDTASAKTAVFETQSITRTDNGDYLADGQLRLRGADIPVKLAFTLKIDGETAVMTGTSTIARLDFGIGKTSDASGAWVSLEIPLEIKVTAKRTS
ncbi:MAG: YceI family protein [Pseudomonadota bacterium]